jgi:hypothetical protein
VIDLVGQHGHGELLCDPHQLLAGSQRQGIPTRIVVGRDDVEKEALTALAAAGAGAGPGLRLQLGAQIFKHDAACRIRPHRHQVQTVLVKHLEREKIGRLLNEHNVARAGQHCADHIQALADASGGEKSVRVNRLACTLGRVAFDELRELRAVKQRVVPVRKRTRWRNFDTGFESGIAGSFHQLNWMLGVRRLAVC